MTKRSHRIGVLGVLLTIALTVLSLYTPAGALNVGEVDLKAYHSAFQLYAEGKNPYDPVLLQSAQQAYGNFSEDFQFVWNPPWIFPLLSPVLSLPWESAVPIWMVFNISALFLVSFLGWKLESGSKISWLSLLLFTALFFPAWETIAFGQLSLFIALATVGALLAWKHHHDFLCGALFFVPSIKPHVIYLLVIILALIIIRERRFKILLGFVGAAAIFSALLLAHDPEIFWKWVYLQGTPLDLKSVTLVTPAREMLLRITGTAPSWPLYAIPALALGTVLIFKSAVTTSKGFFRSLTLLLPLSFLTAPYGWSFDQSILLIAQAMLIARVYSTCKSKEFQILFAVSLVSYECLILICSFFLKVQHYFAWVPIGFIALHYWVERKCVSKH